jgi:hypothetical protein
VSRFCEPRAPGSETSRIVTRRTLLPLLMLLGLAPGGAACGERVGQGLDRNRCAMNPDGAGCPPRVWPNEISYTNSDEWLREHHDTLIRLEPKVLVLDFYNGGTLASIETLAGQQAAALAESSRFHGYADVTAPPFLEYEILRVVDLADRPAPSGMPLGSSKLPVTQNGTFDPLPLFNQEFADRYAFADQALGRNLMLCELFERGMIHEVWLAVGDDPPRGPLTMERKRTYDASGAPTGFEPCAGGYGCLSVECGVSVRLAHLSPIRGLGCDVEIRTFPFETEGTWNAIPYLGANAVSFFNADFATRFPGISFDSWYEVCGTGSTPCLMYPTSSSVTGVDSAGARFTIDPFNQGCGSARFPPNARFRSDFTNPTPVQSGCEHFGMKDGPGGKDILDTYSLEKIEAAAAKLGSPDCGGGWQVYLRQNMPGLDNEAFGVDGKPMKNWWPFAFY